LKRYYVMKFAWVFLLGILLSGCSGNSGHSRDAASGSVLIYRSDWLHAENPLPTDKWTLMGDTDWIVRQGRLECRVSQPDMSPQVAVYHDSLFGRNPVDFMVEVTTGMNRVPQTATKFMESGFLITHDSITGSVNHGLFAGLDGEGKLFIKNFKTDRYYQRQLQRHEVPRSTRLKLKARRENQGYYLTLYRINGVTGEPSDSILMKHLSPDLIHGRIALVSRSGSGRFGTSWWFEDFQIHSLK